VERYRDTIETDATFDPVFEYCHFHRAIGRKNRLLLMMMRTLLALLCWMMPVAALAAPAVPPGIARQLPAGYVVLANVRMPVAQPMRVFYIVALGRTGESGRVPWGSGSPRPLLIFEQRKDAFVLTGRNDAVVLKADEGGQCDPFLDFDGTISVKGRYFTVQNGVACGQHWTDFVTFRFDDRAGFVLDNERSESWSMNSKTDPQSDALVRDGPKRVRRSPPGRAVPFAKWRRARG